MSEFIFIGNDSMTIEEEFLWSWKEMTEFLQTSKFISRYDFDVLNKDEKTIPGDICGIGFFRNVKILWRHVIRKEYRFFAEIK